MSGSARDVLRSLLDEALVPASELLAELEAYVQRVHARAEREEFVDKELIDRIERGCRGLLGAVGDDAPEATRRLVHAAVRYFLLESDAESDFGSVLGFDDDADVVSAVARFLGRTDLIIEVS